MWLPYLERHCYWNVRCMARFSLGVLSSRPSSYHLCQSYSWTMIVGLSKNSVTVCPMQKIYAHSHCKFLGLKNFQNLILNLVRTTKTIVHAYANWTSQLSNIPQTLPAAVSGLKDIAWGDKVTPCGGSMASLKHKLLRREAYPINTHSEFDAIIH